MKFLKRLFTKGVHRQIIDNIAQHTGYPQTVNGLKELEFSEKDISDIIKSKYVTEYDFPVASIGDQNITYKALRLTKDGKLVARTGEKNSDLYKQLFWWLMGIVSAVIAGLILTLFGVGR